MSLRDADFTMYVLLRANGTSDRCHSRTGSCMRSRFAVGVGSECCEVLPGRLSWLHGLKSSNLVLQAVHHCLFATLGASVVPSHLNNLSSESTVMSVAFKCFPRTDCSRNLSNFRNLRTQSRHRAGQKVAVVKALS